MIQLSVAQLSDGRIRVTDGDETVTVLDSKSDAIRWAEESLEVSCAAIEEAHWYDMEEEVEQLADILTTLTEGGLLTVEGEPA